MNHHRKTYLKVNLNNLAHNFIEYKKQTNKAIFAVVKANAYGLGAVEVSKKLVAIGCQYLCVATLDEALELRQANVLSPILVMGYTPISSVKDALENNITLTIISLDWAKALAKEKFSGLKLHLKVNTSMNRLGHDGLEEVNNSLNLLKHNHTIEGIFTHYACEKNAQKDFLLFKNIVKKINHDFKWVHGSNSTNALTLLEQFTNAARIGIGLYQHTDTNIKLKNVAALKSQVILIRTLKKGESLSYDGLYTADKNLKIAVVSIGYADGVLRTDQENKVFINNKFYKIIGNICMDLLMVAIDDNVNLYDEVEIFGDNIELKSIADSRDTISYEVLTTISQRVWRKYIE